MENLTEQDKTPDKIYQEFAQMQIENIKMKTMLKTLRGHFKSSNNDFIVDMIDYMKIDLK